MSDNTIELDLGTTAQKTTDGEKLPVVLLVVLPMYMVVFLPLAGRMYTRHQVR